MLGIGVCRPVGDILLALSITIIAGCAKATVTRTTPEAGPLPRPDMIIVNDFAVSPDEVKLDRGLMATGVRDAGNRSLTEEEDRLGHMVADKLSQSLVEQLRNAGIAAARNSGAAQITSTTVVLNGEFVTIDQGNQTERVWVGFGLGGSKLRTRIQAIQAGKLVAQGETATKNSLKPGMLLSLRSAASLVVGAASTGVSEAVLETVQADANRTAKEIAKKIKQAYQKRGWLP